MKKLLLATAVAALTTAAQAAPTLYGTAAVEAKTTANAGEGFSAVEFDGAGSKFGIKGTQDLDINTAKAVYQFEYGVNSTAEGKEFTADKRDSFVGLTGYLGTLTIGYQGSVDGVAVAEDFANDGVTVADTRANNLKYVSPVLEGAQFSATADLAEAQRTLSAAVTYDAQVAKLGLGYANQNSTDSVQVSATTSAIAGVEAGFAYGTNLATKKQSVRLVGTVAATDRLSVTAAYDATIMKNANNYNTFAVDSELNVGGNSKVTAGVEYVTMSGDDSDNGNVTVSTGFKHSF